MSFSYTHDFIITCFGPIVQYRDHLTSLNILCHDSWWLDSILFTWKYCDLTHSLSLDIQVFPIFHYCRKCLCEYARRGFSVHVHFFPLE